MCCLKKKQTKGTKREREKKQESEKKKKFDTLNKKMVVSRFLCREFCFDQARVWEDFYISFGLSCFLKRHCANSTTTRARLSLTQNRRHAFIIIIYTTIEREREKTCKYIYSVSCKAAFCTCYLLWCRTRE